MIGIHYVVSRWYSLERVNMFENDSDRMLNVVCLLHKMQPGKVTEKLCVVMLAEVTNCVLRGSTSHLVLPGQVGILA